MNKTLMILVLAAAILVASADRFGLTNGLLGAAPVAPFFQSLAAKISDLNARYSDDTCVKAITDEMQASLTQCEALWNENHDLRAAVTCGINVSNVAKPKIVDCKADWTPSN